MKIEDGKILQPYGKDNFSINFIVTPSGQWIFGANDIDKVKTFKENAPIHGFVSVGSKKPKYHIRMMDIGKDYIIKHPSQVPKIKICHDTLGCKSMFFFLFYDPSDNFVAMNYTTKEDQMDSLMETINVLSVISFYGNEFNVIEEDWSRGLKLSKNQIETFLGNFKP